MFEEHQSRCISKHKHREDRRQTKGKQKQLCTNGVRCYKLLKYVSVKFVYL